MIGFYTQMLSGSLWYGRKELKNHMLTIKRFVLEVKATSFQIRHEIIRYLTTPNFKGLEKSNFPVFSQGNKN